ncbi:MAG TPA: hypothetical protein VN577_07035 [Terriglobales bacterium]|nr:hypothetical protein [Terriglobales bacterium]
MNSVYESLRALLRTKELEIKKLEKEIEALRVVLPIVAEAGSAVPEQEPATSGAKFTPEAASKAKPYTPAEFENVMAQAAAASAGSINIPAPDLTPKPRTNWP